MGRKGDEMLCRASNQPGPIGKVPKRKPGYRAGPSLRTYCSPVKSLRANLTLQEIGKAWRDRGDKMAAKLKWSGVARTTQRE
jgi:hypothetical protein